jgi:hypothetical protein
LKASLARRILSTCTLAELGAASSTPSSSSGESVPSYAVSGLYGTAAAKRTDATDMR